ncbi:hypothetical protein GJ744_003248 [Endocarpon pusillum]|uniref:Uncharacterized protein n=1 Tax=Endocarpon pusillum TaxID=364733 RepID=A0A8H7A9X3_9EURO|nr:hypothetical protein GJ744_003248 [Endocarpon pusillum]
MRAQPSKDLPAFTQLDVRAGTACRHVTSRCLGNLDPERAAPAAPSVDKDPLPRAPLDVGDDGLVGRQRRGPRACGINHVHAGWDRHAACTWRDGVLGQSPKLRGAVDAPKDQLAWLQVRRGDFLAVGACGNDATCEVDAGRGGAAGDDAPEEGDFGEFVIDGVESCDEDLQKDLVGWEEGRVCRERSAGVELQILLNRGGGAGELPGFHCTGELGGHCTYVMLGQ